MKRVFHRCDIQTFLRYCHYFTIHFKTIYEKNFPHLVFDVKHKFLNYFVPNSMGMFINEKCLYMQRSFY